MRFIPILCLLCACSATEDSRDPLERLRDPDPTVRGSAIWELHESKNPAAAPHLAAALSDRAVDVRVSAAMVLQDWEGPEVRAALIRALDDKEEQVRKWAASALARTGDADSLPALRRAQKDPSKDVREAAAGAIAQIDASIQAKEVRYHPPAVVPQNLIGEDRDVYLKAHRSQWTWIVSRTAASEMTEVRLTVPIGTLCEAPPIVTAGAYAGQEDAVRFLDALRRRCAKDPRAIEEFRGLRESCLKLHPPRVEKEE